MYKKITSIVLLIFCCNTLLSLLPSCKRKATNTSKDACSSPICFMYVSAGVYPFNTVTKASVASNSNSVKGTELGLSVVLEGSSNVCYKPQSKSWFEGLSLIPKAYAYAPLPTCNVSLGGDSVIAYNIYSNKDFNQQHPAGASLIDIFTTDDVPSHQQKASYGSNSAIVFEFFCNKNPDSVNDHTFTIALTQADGDIVTISTTPVSVFY